MRTHPVDVAAGLSDPSDDPQTDYWLLPENKTRQHKHKMELKLWTFKYNTGSKYESTITIAPLSQKLRSMHTPSP